MSIKLKKKCKKVSTSGELQIIDTLFNDNTIFPLKITENSKDILNPTNN